MTSLMSYAVKTSGDGRAWKQFKLISIMLRELTRIAASPRSAPDRGYPSATADPLLARSESWAFVSAWLVPNTCSCQTHASCSGQLPRYRS